MNIEYFQNRGEILKKSSYDIYEEFLMYEEINM